MPRWGLLQRDSPPGVVVVGGCSLFRPRALGCPPPLPPARGPAVRLGAAPGSGAAGAAWAVGGGLELLGCQPQPCSESLSSPGRLLRRMNWLMVPQFPFHAPGVQILRSGGVTLVLSQNRYPVISCSNKQKWSRLAGSCAGPARSASLVKDAGRVGAAGRDPRGCGFCPLPPPDEADSVTRAGCF